MRDHKNNIDKLSEVRSTLLRSSSNTQANEKKNAENETNEKKNDEIETDEEK